jgi:hypothetical protein
MANVKFDVGMNADIMTPAEHWRNSQMALRNWELERLRGIKHMRLPSIQGIAVNNALSMGGGNTGAGPDAGFCWSIRRLVVTGLTGSTTPDQVNLYVNNPTGIPLWSFNGDFPNWFAKFGRLELTIYGGDELFLASVGTFNSTSQITLSGELIECPAEMLSKLA